MKANVPEKFYLHPLLMEDGESIVRRCTFERHRDSDIEYTRNDAFVEKALKWIEYNGSHYIDIVDGQLVLKKSIIKDLREYMEGE